LLSFYRYHHGNDTAHPCTKRHQRCCPHNLINACDSRVADEEFLLSKQEYKQITGRDQGERDIGTYSKTHKTFAQYKASGYDKDFYESQRADITLHRAAKKYFDGLGLKKLPTITALKQEYATLLAEKKKLSSGYRAAKDNMRELIVAKDNATKILGLSPQIKKPHEHDSERG